jgi:hypothetical protein
MDMTRAKGQKAKAGSPSQPGIYCSRGWHKRFAICSRAVAGAGIGGGCYAREIFSRGIRRCGRTTVEVTLENITPGALVVLRYWASKDQRLKVVCTGSPFQAGIYCLRTVYRIRFIGRTRSTFYFLYSSVIKTSAQGILSFDLGRWRFPERGIACGRPTYTLFVCSHCRCHLLLHSSV